MLSCSGARKGQAGANATGIAANGDDSCDSNVLQESDDEACDSHLTRNSWSYIQGAGDDEESWAMGLTPQLFWNYATEILGVPVQESLLWPVDEPPEALDDRVRQLVRTHSSDRSNGIGSLNLATASSGNGNDDSSIHNSKYYFI